MLDQASQPSPIKPGLDVDSLRSLLPRGRYVHPRSRGLSSLGIVIVIALIGLVADQTSKAWAFASPLCLAGPREIAPNIVTTALARNGGTLANLGGDRPSTAPLCALN
jgi:hypothetical protein